MHIQTNKNVIVSIELFGHARFVAGVRNVRLALPPRSTTSDLASALASALPVLVSIALDESGSRLLTSYTANLNGLSFMDDNPALVSPNDTIYLFSSQAGG